MTDYLQQSLTGLGAGAVIAVLAIGLVLTFRASNVVNLAHCAMGMYIAYVYYTLRNFDLGSTDRGGNLILPIIGFPTRVHIVDRPTVVTALLIAFIRMAVIEIAKPDPLQRTDRHPNDLVAAHHHKGAEHRQDHEGERRGARGLGLDVSGRNAGLDHHQRELADLRQVDRGQQAGAQALFQ